MSYTVGSLFAGIGGICYGFKQAGCEVLWANEFDKVACETYKYNHPNSRLFCEDIHGLNKPKELGEVDIITSGFPCQAFSNAGFKKGFGDPRGNHFLETARFIKKIRPKAFLLENVSGLKNHDNGNTFEVIEQVIKKKLGYSFISFVINSKDYGNIPQSRSRIYIVGFKGEANWECKYKSKKCTRNFRKLEKIPLTKEIKDILHKGKQDNQYYFQKDHQYYPILKDRMKSKDRIYHWRRVYLRENISGLCPTLTANMGMGGHNVPLIKDKYGFRKLTPSECIGFQGFPEEFNFPQDVAKTQCYKQAGNTVVVPVIKRIADEMIRVLDLKYN